MVLKRIKVKTKHYLLLLLSSIIMLCSFSADVGYYGSYGKTPVLMKRTDFEGAIKTLPPKDLNMTTRINLKASNIYIVELYKGVHVIDNSNPSAPEVIHFINIPGCVDMTIKGQQLFARSAVDLVAIDISDLNNVKEINRVRETFSELTNGDEYNGIPYKFTIGQRPENTVIVAWNNSDNN